MLGLVDALTLIHPTNSSRDLSARDGPPTEPETTSEPANQRTNQQINNAFSLVRTMHPLAACKRRTNGLVLSTGQYFPGQLLRVIRRTRSGVISHVETNTAMGSDTHVSLPVQHGAGGSPRRV